MYYVIPFQARDKKDTENLNFYFWIDYSKFYHCAEFSLNQLTN